MAATVPAGFSETVIAGPSGGNWNEAVGMTFESNGRMYVWERGGRVRFKDPSDPSFTLLVDISEEVAAMLDHGLLGFALDPNFRQNGYIYLLYVVDRHHLLYFGTTNYNSNANLYNDATVGRLTRYTCQSSDGFRSIDPASRLILIGETKSTGFPILSESHGIGSLVFGQDGTLLVSCGDGASPSSTDLGGNVGGSWATQGRTDGIISLKEDVGAFRSQLVDCHNGKVLRIDPATGNGIPSNPFYDSVNPRSPRSRVWVLGLRNPCRMSLRPESGSHNPADGNPGVLYIGDAGWNNWEELDVATGPGQNFGWPLYEGLALQSNYDRDVINRDAPNPLFPASGCSQFFTFKQLLKEDTLDAAGLPPFPNPCNSAQSIPSTIPQFLHQRPALDWNHASAITRTPIYDGSGQAQTANVGASGSPVSGTQFLGNCAIGGDWYTGPSFPAQYRNTYFQADYGGGWIKSVEFDLNNKPVAVRGFLNNGGAIVKVVQNPVDGSLYYISWTTTIRKIAYTGNRTPIAAAAANVYFGDSPVNAQFSSAGSGDPDGQAITYAWNFGDGSPVNNQANPAHTFSAPAGVPTKFIVTLTVTDSLGLAAQTNLIVSVNNTPPNVTINSPVDGSLFPPGSGGFYNLVATVTDAESSDEELNYEWQTFLYHNEHKHNGPPDTNHVTTTLISATGCDGINIYNYGIVLTVTDSAGLSTRREVKLYPDCGPNTPPVISDIANQFVTQDTAAGPLPFTVADYETGASTLLLSGTSSNPDLVPSGNIVFGGSGSNRTVTVMPAAGQTGSATITLTVSDGPLSVSDTFDLTVNPSPSGTKVFTNAAEIAIVDLGAGAPYPSVVNVTELGGTITQVTVKLYDISHTFPDDVDILLVGPGGEKVMIFSDVGGSIDLDNVTVLLDDAAAAVLPNNGPLVSGTFQPTDASPGEVRDLFPAPAPAGPYAATLAAFNGLAAGGVWSLYVNDDGTGDDGTITGGWSLSITTIAPANAAPTISDVPNQSTTVNTATAAIPFTIGDVDTAVGSLTLSGDSSNPTLLPSSNIVFSGSGSNQTVTLTPAIGQTGSATITVTVSDGFLTSNDSFVITVNKGQLMVTGITANDKAYDGNTTATVDASAAVLAGVIGDDEVTLSASGAGGTFDTPMVGNGKTVQVAGLTIGGVDAGNYVLTQPTALANITPTGLTVTVDNKSRAYGAGNPALTGTLAGVQGDDNITATYATAATPASPVGAYDIVPVLVAPDGDLGNYNVTSNNGVLTITKAGATVTLGSLQPVYNGTPKRVITATGPAGLTVNVTYNGNTAAPTNAGSYLVVGTIVDANYEGAVTNTLFITKAGLTVTGITANNKVYDANTTATLNVAAAALVGVIGDDVVTLNAAGANGTFNNPMAGVGKAVQVTGLTTSGADTGNYVLTQPTALASITAKPVTPVIVANDKTYDGNTAATLGSQSVTGIIGAEVVTLGVGAVNFDTKNVGIGKTVTATALTLGGVDAGNYVLGALNASDLADIIKAGLTVTADSKTRMYGIANPTLTATITGFVDGETLATSGVTGAAALSTTATVASPVAGNPYPITATLGTLAAGNYSFNFVAGSLIIEPSGNVIITSIARLDDHHTLITGVGEVGVIYTIQASPDLTNWQEIGTATADENGAFEFEDPSAASLSTIFYRVARP